MKTPPNLTGNRFVLHITNGFNNFYRLDVFINPLLNPATNVFIFPNLTLRITYRLKESILMSSTLYLYLLFLRKRIYFQIPDKDGVRLLSVIPQKCKAKVPPDQTFTTPKAPNIIFALIGFCTFDLTQIWIINTLLYLSIFH